jgi:hypothetical protein
MTDHVLDLAARSRGSGANSSARVYYWLALAVIAAALFVLYIQLFSDTIKNADAVNGYMIGRDMGAGNWRLQHWYLPLDNFWLQDALAYAVATRVFGDRPMLMVLVPAAAWVGVTFCAWLVARRGAANKELLWPAVVIAALIAVPVIHNNRIMVWLSVGSDHIITILQCLVMFLLAERFLQRGGGMTLAGVLLFGVIAVSGDPLAVFIAAAPVAGGAILSGDNTIPSRRLSLLAVAVLAVVLGHAIVLLNTGHGGFIVHSSESTRFEFAPFLDISRNIALVCEAILGLWGADFFGLPLRDAVPQILRLPLLALAVWLAVVAMRRLVTAMLHLKSADMRFLDCALLVGIAVIFAICSFSRVMVDFWSGRYLLPVFIYGAIFIARQAPPLKARFAIGVLALCGSVIAANAYQVRHFPTLKLREGIPQLTSWLEEHHMTFGYAQYWTASPIAVASRGQVAVLPLIGNQGKIIPDLWNTRADWFPSPDDSRRPFFVVVDPPNSSDGGFTRSQCEVTFGPPAQRITVADFTIEIYR